MEPLKEAITLRLARLNRQLLGKVLSGTRRTLDRETLFDALVVLYDECNKESLKKNDELVRTFLDKYRSTLAELRRARVCSADFEMIQIIGKGHFGNVHVVREKHSGDIYALKSLKKEAALTRRGVACYEEERDILAAGAVPWLVKLQYAFQDTTNLYLVMEFCPGGDLAGFLARRKHPLSEKDAAFYVAEVTHALRALHALGYVHRDVKPHNIFLDRCGHVKLGDFGSAARLTEGGSVMVPVGTPDYVAPELLSSTDSPLRHSSACDYWSLGVVAFELVTLRRPFSSGKEDSLIRTLGNIQKYEREVDPKPPFDPLPAAPSEEWRSLVTGLLTVQPSKRYHYLDTLQHPALTHLSPHSIRDQPPPWVPTLRSPIDTSYFADIPREASPPSSIVFRAKEPFSGQLPFVGFSFVFSDDNEDHSGGFSASHDCTAIDLAAYKSAEKLAAVRGREVAALQAKLAAMEAGEQATADRLQDEAEMQRSKLQREITDLIVQNKRLQRQLEVEHDERRAQERAGLELVAAAKARYTKELSSARSKAAELEIERDSLKDKLRQLEKKVSELQAECERTAADAETAKALHVHYKDSIAKERALRRQTLSGGEQEAREAGARVATAEATAAKETRAREEAERKMALAEDEKRVLVKELEDLQKELAKVQESNANRERDADSVTEELRAVSLQLTQERSRANALFIQVQELQITIQEASTREVALEEQRARTEARLQARLEEAEARAAHAQQSDARYREKVKTLEQLVRQLEREVSALEARNLQASPAKKQEVMSDTESVGGTETGAEVGANAQVTLLKEQLQRIETQLQARTEEMAALRQETRAANLARWRKEKELSDLTTEAKSSAREVKRLEERLSIVLNARKTAEQKVTELQNNLDSLRPELEAAKEELKFLKGEHSALKRTHETIQAEVDRSRNDIRKLKSELQYSEKRRIHAEEQAECAMRERAHLRDEAAQLRASNTQLEQNNKALQEACSMLEEQLTDLEKLSDLHELKNRDLEAELSRVRTELQNCRVELREAERAASENRTSAALARQELEEARDRAHHLQCELNVVKERLEMKECRMAELEMQVAELEAIRGNSESQLGAAARRTRDLMEECAALRTRAQEHHAAVMRLQAQLAEAQGEVKAGKEAAEAAAAWWRTREVRADATIRQQSKLINLLQAKLEEANRKKCSLSNKLFGRSGRRPTASPPLRKANKELRDEVERLRTRLAVTEGTMPPQTPKRDMAKKLTNGVQSIDVPDSAKEDSLQLIWSDSKREKIHAKVEDGALLCSREKGVQTQAHLVSPMPKACGLTQQEAQRAFTIRMEQESSPKEATAVCSSSEQRSRLLSQLNTTLSYSPRRLLTLETPPECALSLAHEAVAIGCTDGLRSLRGFVQLEWGPRVGGETGEVGRGAVTAAAVTEAQALLVRDGMLLHASRMSLASALRRAESLRPVVDVTRVDLPDDGPIHLLQAASEEIPQGGACVAVATGRRVHLLRWDAAAVDFKILRSLTVDRPPHSLLLTSNALYIAGEKPFRVCLPNGTLETFGLHEPTIQAAAKKHSPPRAILLIRENPLEILICYSECGVFVDENGKRTRSEDAKWRSRVSQWAFSRPFLYNISKDSVAIIHINEEAYCAPPCTCDTRSLTSTSSDYTAPESFRMNIEDSALLGTTAEGVFLRSRSENEFTVLLMEGLLAMRSVGASVMSLDSVSMGHMNSSNSSEDEPGEVRTEVVAVIEHDVSVDNEPRTAFQADIRRRAAQLRARQARERRALGDAITDILKSDVGPKKAGSSTSVSGFSSDTESDGRTYTVQSPNDLCAEMFARQVRFQ